jgi:phage-related protein
MQRLMSSRKSREPVDWRGRTLSYFPIGERGSKTKAQGSGKNGGAFLPRED